MANKKHISGHMNDRILKNVENDQKLLLIKKSMKESTEKRRIRNFRSSCTTHQLISLIKFILAKEEISLELSSGQRSPLRAQCRNILMHLKKASLIYQTMRTMS